MPIGVPRGNVLLPWPLARDLIYQVAVGEGASSSGAASNQVIAGRDVYLRECARCHGPIEGEGMTAPGLFGAEPAKKLESFQTPQALFAFIRLAMPQDRPGSLPDEDYWAVLAFVLARNGFIEEHVTLGPATVQGLALRR